MLVFSLVIFLLTLPLVFGIRAKKSYDDVYVSRRWENMLSLPSGMVGIFFGFVLVYVSRYRILDYPDWNHPPLSALGISELWLLYLFAGFVCGVIALIFILVVSERGARVGRAMRDDSIKRASNYYLFREAENRIRELVKQTSAPEDERAPKKWEAIRLVRQISGILPGDAQFEVLKGLRDLGWMDSLTDEFLGELNRLLSEEEEQVTEERPQVQREQVRQLGTLLLAKLAQHPLIAEALREQQNRLAKQEPSLQRAVNRFKVRLGKAHGKHERLNGEYTQTAETLRVNTLRVQEIARLLGEDAPEQPHQQ